jgi:hypothetical protein
MSKLHKDGNACWLQRGLHALLAHLQRPESQNVTLIYHSIQEQKNMQHNNHVTAFHR